MTAIQVMIVEDSDVVALILRSGLENLGYAIAAVVPSGESALQEIARLRPDIVLMDINIAGDIDGIETARRIPAEYHISVIYLTSASDDATLDRARATNPYGYLLKPVAARELHATIQMVLERRRTDLALRESEQRLEAHNEKLNAVNALLEKEMAHRAKAEAALAEFQKMEAIGQLSGGIAHDFNNLLQGVSLSLSVLQRQIAQGKVNEADTLIREALTSIKSAATMIDRLLAFAQRQPLVPEAAQCIQIIAAMKETLTLTVGESIQVEVVSGDGAWLTRCDVNQLEAAILNIAINARDSMPSGGKFAIDIRNLTVAAESDGQVGLLPGEYVRIALKDTGVGMNSEVAAKAFDPLFTTKPMGHGTGLGLSMVYGFALQSKGYAKLESELGRGTTVNLYLPRFPDDISNDPRTAGAVTVDAPVGHGQEVVLVVEDEFLVRMLLVDALNELGYLTLEAEDGLEGLAILQSAQRIDLLVTDIGLPGLNGRQVADGGRLVRPELKVLFMTGYAAQSAMVEGIVEQRMNLIKKPFDLEVITQRIGEMLAEGREPFEAPSDAVLIAGSARGPFGIALT